MDKGEKKASGKVKAESKSQRAKSEERDSGSDLRRLVILAAKRSKQLQKGSGKAKRGAGKNERNIKTLGIAGPIGLSRIRSAVRQVAQETSTRES